VATEANAGTPRLVVAEPADRRDLQPCVGTGSVDLDVVGAVVALAHVASADLDHPVRQSELGDRTFCPCDHVVEQIRRLLGCGIGHHLDLVELVGPQHPARVTTGRTRLASIRGAVSHQSNRQLGVVQRLLGVDRRQRSFRSRARPQIVAFDRVGVVREFRELTSGRECRCADERRRADLLVGVGVEVESVLAQGPGERCACATLHREHRAGDLGGAFVVEDPELLGRLPVRNALMVRVFVEQPDRSDDDRVVVLARAVRRGGVREIRDAEQQLVQGRRDLVVFRRQRLLLRAQFAALRLERLCLVGLAVAAELADLLGQTVDAGANRVTLAGDVEQAGIESGCLVDVIDDARTSTPGQRLLDAVEVGAQQALVDHGSRGYCASQGAAVTVSSVRSRTARRCRGTRVSAERRWGPGRAVPGRTTVPTASGTDRH